jgi:hypothetical protein
MFTWNKIWYVSKTLESHYASNLEFFKRIKRSFAIETKLAENEVKFIKGIGSVEVECIIGNDLKEIRIEGVFYVPELDRNVLSYNKLIQHGFIVNIFGGTCTIDYMFDEISDPIKQKHRTDKEKAELIRQDSEFEEYKQQVLGGIFEQQ